MAKILIAEDDRAVRSLIRMTLDAGVTDILEVDDGEAALQLARRELPQLIFLDWSMPGSDGLEVCRALRDDPRMAEIKIVMLTARAEAGDREAALAAGADDYITKPFSPIQLLDKVIEVLGPGALLESR
jgi:two-component system phosphate regulon response regulator PhoB